MGIPGRPRADPVRRGLGLHAVHRQTHRPSSILITTRVSPIRFRGAFKGPSSYHRFYRWC
jgi:hypothetical protein